MNELCRLCGERNENGTDIFDKSSENQHLAFQIHQILGIEVFKEDVLPTCVCTTCRDFLNNVALFVDSCRKVQERLKLLHENFTSKEHEFVINNGIDPSFTSAIERLDDESALHSESIEKNDIEIVLYENGTSTNNISSEKSKIRYSHKETPSSTNLVESQCSRNSVDVNETNADVTVKSSDAESSIKLVETRSRKSDRILKSVKFPSDFDHSVNVESTKRVTRSSSSSFSLPSDVQIHETESSDFDDNDNSISDDTDSDYIYEPSINKLKTSCRQDDAKPEKLFLKIKPSVRFEKMTCDVCKQKFSHELALAEHMNLHTGNRPFKCRLCEKTFRIRKELNAHLRTVHSEKEFRCPFCDYICRYRGKLTEHVKNLHEKPFSCAICGYRTGLKCKLANHIAHKHKEFTPVANEATPFVCEICGTSLKSKKSLYSHRMNMHFPEPKQCQTCGVIFPSSARYKGHLLICGRERKRYPCGECGRTYASKASLDDHMNKHRDLRPYKCDICERAFRTRTHLDSHKFVHRGPLFHCEICGQRFNRKDNMNVHVRKHYTNPDSNLMVDGT